MKYKILSIGKIKNKNLLSEVEALKNRISRIEELELKEVKDSNSEIVKRKEYEQILPHLKSDEYKVILCEKGKQFSTKEFYEFFKKQEKMITFIISGAFGHSQELEKNANLLFSLSNMTFTHEQAKYLLLEQIYRAECFEKNIPYTK